MKKIILLTLLTIYLNANTVFLNFKTTQFSGEKKDSFIFFNLKKTLDHGDRFLSCIFTEENSSLKNILCLEKGKVAAKGSIIEGTYKNNIITIYTPLIELKDIDISKLTK